MSIAILEQPKWYERDPILNGVYTKWYGLDYVKFVQLTTSYRKGMPYLI